MESPKNKDGEDPAIQFTNFDDKPADSVKPRRKESSRLDPDLFRRIFTVADDISVPITEPEIESKPGPEAKSVPAAAREPAARLRAEKPVMLPSVVATLPPPAPKLIGRETAEKVRSAIDEEIDSLRAANRNFNLEPRTTEEEPNTEDMVRAAYDFDRLMRNLNMPIPFALSSILTAYLFDNPKTPVIKSMEDLYDYFKANGVRKLFSKGNDYVEFLGRTYTLKKKLENRNLVIPEIMEAFLLTIRNINRKFDEKKN